MLLQSIIIAFSMYSKIPMPRVDWNKKNMKYALCFFPFVGIVIGAVIYLVGNLAKQMGWNPLLFSAVMSVIPVVITGGIHLDGMLDTIDALSSYGDKEKRLEILKDPHAGAFAIIGGIVYFVISLGLWSEMSEKGLGILSVTYLLSRTLSGFSVVTFPLSKNSGLAAAFQEGAHKRNVRIVMILYFIIEGVFLVWMQPMIGLFCLGSALLCFGYYYYMCKKHFGGVTGDLAGYFLQVCELVLLAVIVIVGKIILI